MGKRLGAVLAAGVLAFALVACNETKGSAQAGAAPAEADTSTETSTETTSTETTETSETTTASGGIQPTTPVSEPTTSEPTVETSEPEPIDEPEPTDEPEPSTRPTNQPAGEPAECLYDTWLMSNPVFEGLVGQYAHGGSLKTTGQVHITFRPDGTFDTTYTKWKNTVRAKDQKIVITRDGTDSGTFTYDEGSLTMVEMTMGSTVVMKMGPMTLPSPATEPDTSTVIFDCLPGDDLASVTDDEGNIILLARGPLAADLLADAQG